VFEAEAQGSGTTMEEHLPLFFYGSLAVAYIVAIAAVWVLVRRSGNRD
jgi:hypothetical protein